MVAVIAAAFFSGKISKGNKERTKVYEDTLKVKDKIIEHKSSGNIRDRMSKYIRSDD